MKPIRNQELEEAVQRVETDSKINLIVPTNLKNPHPFIKDITSSHFMTNKHYPMEGKVMTKGETFDLIVGKANFVRAKLILDTFIKAIEGRGHQIRIEDGNTFLETFGEKLRIRFWEKSKYIGQVKEYAFRDKELTGILSIQYFRILNYVEREWCDTPNVKLEEKLGRVIGSLEYYGHKEKAERLEREQRWRDQKLKDDILREHNSRKEADFNNFKILLSNSLRWEKALSIRAFINHLQKNPEHFSGTENLNDWINWATNKADWFDPTISKADPIMKPYGEFHETLLNQTRQLDKYNIGKL